MCELLVLNRSPYLNNPLVALQKNHVVVIFDDGHEWSEGAKDTSKFTIVKKTGSSVDEYSYLLDEKITPIEKEVSPGIFFIDPASAMAMIANRPEKVKSMRRFRYNLNNQEIIDDR